MLKITGLDEMSRTLEQAQRAFADLDGELGTVRFDPNDPASIEAAIQHAHALIDGKLGDYVSNPLVAPMIEASKERFREAIIERAAAARLKGDSEDEQQN
ncbi:hypothetical protein M446_4951 [Methylobacterium sp. 4-46]|uniref:hypothetical protein n=1 Tax=unclassified Methylobacterium TaxID=2615210 RepID=UPI000165CB14|nr:MULTISPECIES: hypothetical protein [Methylobacterium]ACA19280.1 hypothetical protein M446_4951 [Methylobacterium sp. 4-46]WFT78484.1 hypothetical protein QA634_24890 [Methylobacterium nodulans]